jgi:hypothetical protein
MTLESISTKSEKKDKTSDKVIKIKNKCNQINSGFLNPFG